MPPVINGAKNRLASQARHESVSPRGMFAARKVVLEFAALQTRQVRRLLYSSERLNTRATHIQCCPREPQASALITADSLPTESEARLLPALQVFYAMAWVSRQPPATENIELDTPTMARAMPGNVMWRWERVGMALPRVAIRRPILSSFACAICEPKPAGIN